MSVGNETVQRPTCCARRHRATRGPVWGTCVSLGVHGIVLGVLATLVAELHDPAQLQLEVAVRTNEPAEIVSFDFEHPLPAMVTTPAEVTQGSPVAWEEPELQLEIFTTAPPQTRNESAVLIGKQGDPQLASGGTTGQEGKFFGAAAYGDDFVYIVDMSTSMGYASHYGQTRFRVACEELLRSVGALRPDQRFSVILFCYRTRFMFDRSPRLVAATEQNKQLLRVWMETIRLGGGTDPRLGVMTALRMQPDAIFLLSDGEFNGQGVNAHGIAGDPSIERVLRRYRGDMVPLHTIALEDLRNRRRLRALAVSTEGTHRFVGNRSAQEVLLMDLRSRDFADAQYAMRCILAETPALHSEQQLKQAVGLLSRKLTVAKSPVRKLAYQSLVKLADGVDLGPAEPEPTMDDYEAAQKRWRDYWDARFKQARGVATRRG